MLIGSVSIVLYQMSWLLSRTLLWLLNYIFNMMNVFNILSLWCILLYGSGAIFWHIYTQNHTKLHLHQQLKADWFLLARRDAVFFQFSLILCHFLRAFECLQNVMQTWKLIARLCLSPLWETDFLTYAWHLVCIFCTVSNMYGSTIGKLPSVAQVVLYRMIFLVLI